MACAKLAHKQGSRPRRILLDYVAPVVLDVYAVGFVIGDDIGLRDFVQSKQKKKKKASNRKRTCHQL